MSKKHPVSSNNAHEARQAGSPYCSDAIGVNGDLFANLVAGSSPADAKQAINAQDCMQDCMQDGVQDGVQEQAAVYSEFNPHQDNDQGVNGLAKPSNPALETLLSEELAQTVWRSSDAPKRRYKTLGTGFETLNKTITIGGWPLGANTEIGLADAGIGELRLLLPALKALLTEQSSSAQSNKRGRAQVSKHCLLIAPPHQPYAPALAKMGLLPSQIAVVRARSLADTLWSAEQALLSESCVAVLTWTGRHNLTQRETRRLQLAAEKSKSLHVVFRDIELMQQASVSCLRLEVSSDDYSRAQIRIVKQPQGWAGQQCVLPLPPFYERWQRLPVQLLPHSNQAYRPHKQSLGLPKQLRILAKAAHASHAHRAAKTSTQNHKVITLKRVS